MVAFDTFWGEQDQGYNAIFGRLRQGKHICEQVLTLVKERAAIEEDYAKKLAKLAKTFSPKEEIGTLREALDTLRTQLEISAKTHAAMASDVRTQIEKRLQENMAIQAAVRKKVEIQNLKNMRWLLKFLSNIMQYQAVIDKHMKLKQSQTTAVLKSKERYESKSLEVENLNLQLRGSLPQKEFDKLTLRRDKAQQAANQSEVDYKSGTAKLMEISSAWVTDWKTVCAEALILETKRLEFLRDDIWDFANMLSSVCVSDDQCCENVRMKLEQFDLESDLELFVKTRSTGAKIPEPIEYVKYRTREELERQAAENPYPSQTFTGTLGHNSLNANNDNYKGRFDTSSYNFSTASFRSDSKEGSIMSNTLPRYLSGDGELPTNFDTADRKLSLAADPLSNQPSENGDSYDDDEPYDPYDLPKTEYICEVQVKYDYLSQAVEELTIKKGQIIPVWSKGEDGWWEGSAVENGRTRKGLFPSNFVTVL
ncbi:hypothetical protein HK098_000621 [Nowakowskiella sp. JEL0407]|nr:hypothetical protein HK098_000621 [Nowakowskiella sp. JEL0407]